MFDWIVNIFGSIKGVMVSAAIILGLASAPQSAPIPEPVPEIVQPVITESIAPTSTVTTLKNLPKSPSTNIPTNPKLKSKPSTFTTPGGAIIDEKGNVLNQAEIDIRLATEKEQAILQQEALQKQQVIDAATASKAKQEAQEAAAVFAAKQAALESANVKAVVIDGLKKSYGLSINILEAKKIELNVMQNNIQTLYLLYVQNPLPSQAFIDTEYKRGIEIQVHQDFDKANPMTRGVQTVQATLSRIGFDLNTQIAQLQNELERKLLEVQ